MLKAVDEAVARRYLLGEATEEESAALESSCFASDEQFEELLALEEELIDGYVAGELPERERLLVEQRYLASAEGRGRVAFAKDLAAKLRTRRRGTRIPSGWSAALAAALVLGFSALVVDDHLLRSRLRQAQTEQEELRRQAAQERARSEALAHELEQAQASPPVAAPLPRIESLVLAPGTVRGAGASRPIVPPGADIVRLQVFLDDAEAEAEGDHRPPYAARVQTAEGREVFRRERLRAVSTQAGTFLEVRIPGRLLAHGDYIVTVTGMAGGKPVEIGDYAFSVARR